jgi:ELWxxDGT repeat protein
VLVKPMVEAPLMLTNVNGTLYFYGDDGTHGYELWTSDGTEAGTVMVKDIVPGPGGSIDGTGSWPQMVAVGNRAFFTAFDAVSGIELWVSDGSEGGTTLVEDINPAAFGSAPLQLTELNGALMFTAADGISAVHTLWRSDGTAPGTYMVSDIFALDLTNVNGTLFFNGNEPDAGSELWRSDGTAGGTQLVKNIYPEDDGSGPMHITDVNGRAFFIAVTPGPQIGLWVSDGTDAGTERLRALEPYAAGGYIAELTAANGLLYFRAYDSISNSISLFRSDGTVSGTVPVPIPNGGFPGWLTNVDGTLFFSADDAAHGRELWKVAAPVDTVPPTVASSGFAFQTAHEVVIQFSENVATSLSADDLQITALPGGPTITPSSVAYDAATNTATFAIAPRLGDGEYRATLAAGAVADAAGNALAQDHTLDFFFLNADANRDRRVNLQDFNLLAANFGQSNRTFSQGDFNYDGQVNLGDFNLLAQQFGTSLAPHAGAAAGAARNGFATGDDDDERSPIV